MDSPANNSSPDDGESGRVLQKAAHAIHAAYCKHFIDVNYDAFRESWHRAAALAQTCNADPEGFVEAQRDRSVDLDPEDLESADSVRTYRQFEINRCNELIFGFQYAEREFNVVMQRNLSLDGKLFLIMQLGLQASYWVFRAKTVEDDEHFIATAKVFGGSAAAEIRSSRHFREFLQAKYPQIDMDSFLDELDRETKASRVSGNKELEGQQ